MKTELQTVKKAQMLQTHSRYGMAMELPDGQEETGYTDPNDNCSLVLASQTHQMQL
jgi:hypothetical protein